MMRIADSRSNSLQEQVNRYERIFAAAEQFPDAELGSLFRQKPFKRIESFKGNDPDYAPKLDTMRKQLDTAATTGGAMGAPASNNEAALPLRPGAAARLLTL
jgi:hypothetical protein